MSGRVWVGVTVAVLAMAAFVAYRSRPPAAPPPPMTPPPMTPPPMTPIDEAIVTAGPHPYSLIVEPITLMAVERRIPILPNRTYQGIVDILTADITELARRPGIGGEDALNHSFDARWLTDLDTKLELVGLIPRLDRAFAEPNTCGELRRVYRLSLTRRGRPTTRLPMTLSVLSLIPSHQCREIANALLSLPSRGRARIDALTKLYSAPTHRVEVNLQNLHGTATPQDNEDHAEYLLRSFDIAPDGGVTEHPLLSTPRENLTPSEKDRLANYLRSHFADVDRGTLVLPTEFLATRAVSVSPRGLARERNRVFRRLFAESDFADLPFTSAQIARSPKAFLRRLDQGTCQGCHQSRAVAGFHLLGEERNPHQSFNALYVGISNQLAAELPWREALIQSIAADRPNLTPRPFAEDGAGAYGARCGLGDPGFVPYRCAEGLECKDDRGDELGACLPKDGPHEGDACEPATVTTVFAPSGDHLSPLPSITCRIGDHVIVRDGCLGNGLGFPGGMCTDRCTQIGALEPNGTGICAELPMSGYEEACFRGTNEPIERCIASRLSLSLVRSCDATHACRDDYACARVSANAPRGACVPPYFVFQARVDGPRADR